MLLNERKDGASEDDGQDNSRVEPIPDDARDGGRKKEDQDDRTLELAQEEA